MVPSTPATTDYPTKQMGAGALFFNAAGELLLVKPTYREGWSIPGGVVEDGESPREACVREVCEEIGLSVEVGRLLAVEYTSLATGPRESLQYLFDGGVLDQASIERIVLPPAELSAFRFVPVAEAVPILTPRLGRRVPHALEALATGGMAYLEDGVPPGRAPSGGTRDGRAMSPRTGLSPDQHLYHLADELRGIARLGLIYAQNLHDRDRYERVLRAAAQIVSVIEGQTAGEGERTLEVFQENLAHVSPVAGAEAVVVRDGKILLHRRADSGLWAMCGGLCEIGETLAEAAARELHEEARVRGRITRLLGLFDSLRWRMSSKVHLYAAVFEAESDDEPSPTPEATELGFFGPDELPPLSPGHAQRIPIVLEIVRGERPAPYVDLL